MEAQSAEETDRSIAEEADIDTNDHLTQPDDGSCAVQVQADDEDASAGDEAEEDSVQNAAETPEDGIDASAGDEAEEDSVQNAAETPEDGIEASAGDEAEEDSVQNAAETPEDGIDASVRDEAAVSHGSEDGAVSAVEIQVEEDSRQSTDNLQPDPEENQELLRELQREHENLSQLNYQLQVKLAEYLQIKSGEELQASQEGCLKYPDILEDLKRHWEIRKQKHVQQRHIDDLLRQSNEKMEQIELEWNMLMLSQREVLLAALEQTQGKTAAKAVVERLLSAARKCEDQLVSAQQENVELNRMMRKLESGLQVKQENLDGKMSYVDFEQLNTENQTFSEKIQECKEELLKLKRMLPQTGQILMHVKEKLSFVRVENQKKQAHFDEMDALILHEQQTLTQTMQTRDKLRFDNLRIRQDSGLLGQPALLQDLEDTEDKREALERQVEMLKRS